MRFIYHEEAPHETKESLHWDHDASGSRGSRKGNQSSRLISQVVSFPVNTFFLISLQLVVRRILLSPL